MKSKSLGGAIMTVKSKFQLSVNDLKSTLSKASALPVKLTFACNLSEINVFAVAR